MEQSVKRKISSSRIRWILKEIICLLEEGIISPGTADRLRQYYEERLLNYKKILLYIFGTFGAILIGGGIVLVIAQYWQQMPRELKIVLALMVLLIAQLVAGRYCLYGMVKKRFFNESLGVFWSMSFGAVLVLLGNALNLPTMYRTLLFTWSLGILPIMYLLQSLASLLVYSWIVLSWLSVVRWEHGVAVPFYALFLFIIPFYYREWRKYGPSHRYTILKYWLAIFAIICLALLNNWNLEWMLLPTYAGLFSLLYFSGELYEQRKDPYILRPLLLFGLIGIFVHSLVFSREDIWLFYHIDYLVSEVSIPSYAFIEDIVFLPLMLCVSSMVLSVKCIIKYKESALLIPALFCPLVIIFNVISIWIDKSVVPMFSWLLNGYTLVFASLYVYRGFREQSLFHMNVGSLFILSVIIIRLFAYNMSLWIQGVAFICVGTAYILLNYRLVKSKRKSIVA